MMVISKHTSFFNKLIFLLLVKTYFFGTLLAQVSKNDGSIKAHKDTSYKFNIHTESTLKQEYTFNVNAKTPFGHLFGRKPLSDSLRKILEKRYPILASSPRYHDSIIGILKNDTTKWCFLYFYLGTHQSRIDQSHADYQSLAFLSVDSSSSFSSSQILNQFTNDTSYALDTRLHKSVDIPEFEYKKWYFIKIPGYLMVRFGEDLGSEKSHTTNLFIREPLFVSNSEEWYFFKQAN